MHLSYIVLHGLACPQTPPEADGQELHAATAPHIVAIIIIIIKLQNNLSYFRKTN
jgi:hypothetical protein